MGTRNLPPKSWMLGASPELPAPQQSSSDETEVTLPTCISVPDFPPETSEDNLSPFKGQLDSAVSQYISQVKDLGFKDEPAKDHKLLAVKFQLNAQDIKLKDDVEDEDTVKEILREDKGQQTQPEEEEEEDEEEELDVLEEEVPSLDNPLYLTLSECSSGLLDPFEEPGSVHFYENSRVLREDEHIYENVDNSAGEYDTSEGEEHLYDTLPKHKPHVPPKPDFLSQLAARQSEPVKRAWNPFVSLSVETGEPTPPLSTASSLSSPDSSHTDESSPARSDTNPFRSSAPRDTSEQTLLLEGSETSDLGSSGGEYDVVSVEDWPLPPTPPPGEEVIVEQEPLPPPPPEIALQQLEEEVLRQEEEDRKLALQKAKQAIEREYGRKAHQQDVVNRVEAVNTSLQQRLKAEKERKPVKQPKIIQIDEDDSEEFETPAIRHSVIIELKDSCPDVPKSLRPSDVRRASIRRSQSLKYSGVVRRSSTHGKVTRRESLTQIFPSLQDQLRKPESPKDPAPPEAVSDKKETSLDPCDKSVNESVIKISGDESWKMKDTVVDDAAPAGGRDPFTGSPIAAPPLSPVPIAAPPAEFQNDDGMDGVYSASVVSIHSEPSSLVSTAPDSLLSDVAPTEAIAAPETIPEEPAPDSIEPDSLTYECDSPRGKDAKGGAHSSRNLGAAIMERHEIDMQKKRDNLNLPEHSLLEFGDTVRDLEQQRRSVIKQMTVKAKRKDTWIKTFNMHDQGHEEAIPVAPSRSKRKTSPCRPSVPEAPAADLQPAVTPAPQKLVLNSSQQDPTFEESPAIPPKTSRKKKAAADPQVPPPVAEENVIAPKNTEVLAALFSSPSRTPKDTQDLQNIPSLEADIITLETEASQKPVIDFEIPTSTVPEVPDVQASQKSEPTDEVAGTLSFLLDPSPILIPALAPAPVTAPALAPVPESLPAPEILPIPAPEPAETMAPQSEQEEEEEVPAEVANDGEDLMVKEKNELNLVHSAMVAVCQNDDHQEEKKEEEEKDTPPLAQDTTDMGGKAADDQHDDQSLVDEGEVEYFSILDNKKATKTYWESRMVTKMDDGGWESVANVRFQPLTAGEAIPQPQVQDGPLAVPPPPQFDNSPTESEVSSPPSLDEAPVPAPPEPRPAKQYVYGVTGAPQQDTRGARIVETVAKKPASQENIIEAEIRAQQQRESEMRRQQSLKSTEVREKGASSPASHDSDEGFVDRLEVTGPHPSLPSTPSYTHTLPGTDGEPVIYDAVSPPPPEYLSDRSTPTPSNPPVTTTPAVTTPNATEARIALEIRELKEREDELRQMREELMASRENLLEDEEVRSSASREQLLEDHLTSLTTTTDEGNFSECGDPASSEDKSSDGSNSRMMSPDLHHPGSHLDFGRRRVTVKPYEEEEEDDQPVYTRMQKESVIEREIRLAREREEAYRREKGLLNGTVQPRPAAAPATSAPISTSSTSSLPAASRPQAHPQADGRDVQHRMATSRIQLEIQETSQKERELRDAGKILTTSEETVDAKVTRLSDFSDMNQLESPRSQALPSAPRTSASITPSSTPKRSPSPRSPASPVPNFTPSPALNRNGLSRSLSTNNLSSTSTTRPTKGLMQKFIASRGKMTGSAFVSPPPTLTHITSRGVPTRPMRVEPKSAVIQRETLNKIKPEMANGNASVPESTTTFAQHPKQYYRRSYCTAEEKIQSELKEMQMREEELRRLRAFQMARSQPNLLDIGHEDDQDLTEEEESNHSLSEMNGLRPAQSNPNLLDEPEPAQVPDKTVRRRSALIAQWENRIQQTTDT